MNIKKIKEIVENNTSKAGRYFDMFIQSVIIFSLISFSFETLPELNSSVLEFFRIAEIISVFVFSIEYVLRIIVADKKLKFIFSFYGIIDLFAILPFYLSTGIDLRSLRIFRLFRLFRVFKVLRYNRAIRNFQLAFKEIKEELILFFIMTFFLLYISAVGIYYFENPAQPEVFKSVFHSLWWAVETFTTVGYGDICPVTVGGKVFSFFMLMLGLGIIAVPSGLIASALSKIFNKRENQE